MASLNKIMLIGNLTRDPELRYLASGKAMTRMGLAVNRTWTDKDGKRQEEASFFNLVAFDKRAETLAKYSKKGDRLFVEGRLDARTVTNDKGETHTYHDININEFQFLNSKRDGESKPAQGKTTDDDDIEFA